MELYVKTREEWHNWLEENHTVLSGIWVVYYKKISGKPRIAYNDAVEVALCFGWIDGKIKRVNEDYYIQWFTARRKGSRWSKINIKRAQKLISEGQMRQPGLLVYEEALKKPELVYDVKSDSNIVVPDDLITELKTNTQAYNNFINFPQGSRRMYVLWLNDAKRTETRNVRIAIIVERSARNIRAGMM